MLHEENSPVDATCRGGTGLVAGPNTDGFEPLACVACRSRKLKCDRTKPACARCLKLKVDCAYPESRRKPAFKRRNVRELEERLAHVEVLLKDAAEKTEHAAPPKAKPQEAPGGQTENASQDNVQNVPTPNPGLNGSTSYWNFDCTPATATPSVPFEIPETPFRTCATDAGATGYELLGLGLFEALPPAEMIEELHQAYFTKQHPLIPILHPGRYLKSFYSAPHLRPPMALQYAIWTMATLGSEKHSQYHEAFHRRCRHYLEEDELKGDGEHFLTVAHAQAWALTATAEARNMWFTRAAMSASRCIKLLHMMGLHRLDDPNAEFEMMPTILPPKDWVELEERRRVFWGAFAIDSHASVSTGWPTLIDANEVTTHLPSSEEAFNQGREEKTCRLHDVFTGSSYSSFAAAAVVCHVFNRTMKHANRSQPDDCPSDFEYGKYWNRHRELDNLLSGAFMFLPERFRLPHNVRDPVAVHANLNLHAATICLHNSAYEIANEHNLPDHLKKMARTRMLSASYEVVNIVKLTSHTNAGYRSPFVALALYVACSVFTSQAQEEGLTPTSISNIEFLFTAMEAIGKQHKITLNLLHTAISELEQAGLDYAVCMPKVAAQARTETGDAMHNCSQIPLFARSRVSKRTTGILPPLPGRLPLNKPIGRREAPGGKIRRDEALNLNVTWNHDTQVAGVGGNAQETSNANKRRRVNLSPEPPPVRPVNDTLTWRQFEPVEKIPSTGDTPSAPMSLPHRGGSSTSGSSPSAAAVGSSSVSSSSSGTSPGQTAVKGQTAVFGASSNTVAASAAAAAATSMPGGSHTSGEVQVDMDLFQGLDGWDAAQNGAPDTSAAFAEVAAAMLNDDSWMIMNDVGVNGQPWGSGAGGTGVG